MKLTNICHEHQFLDKTTSRFLVIFQGFVWMLSQSVLSSSSHNAAVANDEDDDDGGGSAQAALSPSLLFILFILRRFSLILFSLTENGLIMR